MFKNPLQMIIAHPGNENTAPVLIDVNTSPRGI
jgi:hypothetical protein